VFFGNLLIEYTHVPPVHPIAENNDVMILEWSFVHVVTVHKFVTPSVRITVSHASEIRGAMALLEKPLSELHSLSFAETVSTPNRYSTNHAVQSVNLKCERLDSRKRAVRTA
jgi:hypothetical protein